MNCVNRADMFEDVIAGRMKPRLSWLLKCCTVLLCTEMSTHWRSTQDRSIAEPAPSSVDRGEGVGL